MNSANFMFYCVALYVFIVCGVYFRFYMEGIRGKSLVLAPTIPILTFGFIIYAVIKLLKLIKEEADEFNFRKLISLAYNFLIISIKKFPLLTVVIAKILFESKSSTQTNNKTSFKILNCLFSNFESHSKKNRMGHA